MIYIDGEATTRSRDAFAIRKMSTERLKRILLPAFEHQKELAEAVSKHSGMTVASAESGLSRLFKDGRSSESLRAAVIKSLEERIDEPEARAKVAEVEAAFDALTTGRIRDRIQTSYDAILQEMSTAAHKASSLFITFPFVAIGGEEEHAVNYRKAIAEHFDLGSPTRRQIFRTCCFASEHDMYEWWFHLVWASVDLFIDPSKASEPSQRRSEAERIITEIALMQEKGVLDVKILRPTSCLVSTVFMNIRGPLELTGYIWHYDPAGKVQAHRVEGAYLQLWGAYIRAVQLKDPCIVASDSDVRTYEDQILRGKLTL